MSPASSPARRRDGHGRRHQRRAAHGGNNTYTGQTIINSGTLQVSNLQNGGVASSIGASTNAASNLILNGGTLQYVGSGATIDRLFSVGTTAGSVLDASGSGALVFGNGGLMEFNGQTGNRTLTLTGNSTAANTVSLRLSDVLAFLAGHPATSPA